MTAAVAIATRASAALAFTLKVVDGGRRWPVAGAVATALLMPAILPPSGAAGASAGRSVVDRTRPAPVFIYGDDRFRAWRLVTGLDPGRLTDWPDDRDRQAPSRLAVGPGGMTIRPPAPPPTDRPNDAEDLARQLAGLGYDLTRIREEGGPVPRLILVRLPRELPRIESIDDRKQIFLSLLLPLVLRENERLLADRERLIRLRADVNAGRSPTLSDRAWVSALASGNQADPDDLDELLDRVDVIPPSLALAQAAVETGWGTSAVAQRRHALFGEMALGRRGVWFVRGFPDLAGAVAAYARNLNRHAAYRHFREQRAEMRRKGIEPDGFRLAASLYYYSERRHDYIRSVQAVIRENRLGPLDSARFEAQAGIRRRT